MGEYKVEMMKVGETKHTEDNQQMGDNSFHTADTLTINTVNDLFYAATISFH